MVEGVRLVVRERPVELEEERYDVQIEPLRDVRELEPAHPVSRVRDDLEPAPDIPLGERQGWLRRIMAGTWADADGP